MKDYKVTYSGNASRFKKFEKDVFANSEREAVEKVYSSIMDENYFPQDDGSIRDCDGHEIADAEDTCIKYDGGYFTAKEITGKYTLQQVINDNNFSGLLKLNIDGEKIDLATTYKGGYYLEYYLFNNDVLLFSGDDYKPSSLFSIDGLVSHVYLLSSLCVQEGDVDADYFKNYTDAQLEWSKSNVCEKLNGLIQDFRDVDSEYHPEALELFTKGFQQ